MLNRESDIPISGIILAGIMIFVLGWGIAALNKFYNLWSSGMSGQAELNQATYNRQIKIKEAEAQLESAKFLAQAEIEHAKGVAEANKIIGNSLKDNENYLKYLWIHNIEESNGQIIYVPTEANLPILESTRHIQNPLTGATK